MRGCLTVLCLLLPLAGFAAEWLPYVGIGGQVGSAFVDVWRVDGNASRTTLCTGVGSEFDGGLTNGRFCVYGGYTLFSARGVRRTSAWTGWVPGESYLYEERQVTRQGWTDRRWTVGARMLLNPHSHARVQPAVGLAMTCGRMRTSEDFTESIIQRAFGTFAAVQTTSHHYNSYDWTDWRLGWKAEMGFLVGTGTPVDLWLLGQLHAIHSEVTKRMDEQVHVEPQRQWILVPSLQVTARYVIPYLTFGGGNR
jgi:hypothetical protein